MPTAVPAQEGDCLCTMAIAAGFLNCAPLRSVGANSGLLNRPLAAGDIVTIPDIDPGGADGATDQRHVFVRLNAPPVSIRFVHGSPNLPYLRDTETTILHISNHQTTRGGLDDEFTFPNGFEFNQHGHADPDTFKVEVVDPQAASPLTTVKLEALRRILRPDGTFGHDVFPAAERARRSRDPLECRAVSSGVAFRSRYIRLVTDETDQAALPLQTLLVTDMTDQGDSTVEILEQAVRATYTLQNCPVGLCQVSKTGPVGLTDAERPARITNPQNSAVETKPRNAVQIAIHILNTTPGANPVVTIPQADRRANRWVRRIYAQAGLAPRLVRTTRIVDPQSNLLAIAEPAGNPLRGGRAATGGRQITFTITSPGVPSQAINFTTVAGAVPLVTAQGIAALVAAPFTATPSQNPAGFTDPPTRRSADVLITGPGGALVTITGAASTDANQPVTVGAVNPAAIQGFPANFLIGSVDQRTLLKNYDTGSDRVDVVVVGGLTSTNLGEAMMHGVSINADPARHAIDEIRFSLFIVQAAMNAGDLNYDVLPHEMGHVLMDLIHAIGPRGTQQLMFGPFVAGPTEASAKRIKERPKTFDSPAGDHRQLELFHLRGGGLLDPF